ncbi:hypothetical protein [Halioxenophilus aromaticivorans]|uniref:Uncharacterized protein n=1 Tax=Halioxenophilus aromaticivorans TaxID=1306992 RepID=A0AAV3U0G9_9ALTE
MEQLTIYEAIQLIRINEDAISTQFQVWLTISFSTIVALFAGRSLLTAKIKWLVTLLYLLSSMAIVATSLYFAEGNAQITAMLAERGVTLAPPIFASISYFVLLIAGMATTVYFIHIKLNDSP